MTQKNLIRCFFLMSIILVLAGCDLSPGGGELIQIQEETEEDVVISENNNTQEQDMIWVHVCGRVENPGVYSFREGSRVFDAIEAAGGFLEDADRESVNLAMTLTDEGKIYVAALGEQKDGLTSFDAADGKINLNTATLDQLMTIPGVGEKRAEAILKLREEIGSFQTVEDLLKAEGIKDGIFQKIKDYVKV